MKPHLEKQKKGVGETQEDSSALERERVWLLRFKKDPKEYDKIIKEYLPAISGYMMRRTGDEQVAEELVQETFSKAFSGFITFEWRGITLGAFLFKIARNVFYAWCRRKKHCREHPCDPMELKAEGKEKTDSALNKQEDLAILNSCMANLTAKQQEALEFYVWGELRTWEIARIMRMKESTVKSHLQRGRESLRRQLTELGYSFHSFDGIIGSAESQTQKKRLLGALGSLGEECSSG